MIRRTSISPYSLVPRCCQRCLVFALGFCLTYIIFQNPPTWTMYQRMLPVTKQSSTVQSKVTTRELPKPTVIPPNCACNYSDELYDFCYHAPYNRNTLGKRFPCNNVDIAKRLGILDTNYIELERGSFPSPVFVTGSSQSHWHEQLRLFKNVQDFMPGQKIVFYDLGLNDKSVAQAKTFCNVEYRKFDFGAYPTHVKKLTEYRWKPIIIAQTLHEFGAIWWMDSSVVWKKSDLSHVYQLVQCRMQPNSSDYHLPAIPSNRDPKWIESGWHKSKWRESIYKCDKFAYLLNGWTGHGIFPATHPTVYEYFPTNLTGLKRESAKMFEAGFAFAVRTREVMENVVKWYVLCALEQNCMAPPHSSLGCAFGTDRFTKYAKCHRYDQSVVNLLLANANSYDRYYYTTEIVDFFNIVRGSGGASPKICNTKNDRNNIKNEQ